MARNKHIKIKKAILNQADALRTGLASYNSIAKELKLEESEK